MFKQLLSYKAIFAVLFLFAATTAAKAQELAPPQLVIQKASEEMLNALVEYEAELESTPEKIFDLAEEILIPHFDFQRMSRLALGRNWNDASEEQQQRFVEEFRLLLVRTYATAMLEYTDEEFRFLPFRDDMSDRRVNVPINVIRRGAPNVPVSIALYQNNDGDWKVYDVRIEGISLVTNYRSTFTRDIRNGGIDKLIESISQRNQRARS
jgi:phospholipid transport system substrate-binding protein